MTDSITVEQLSQFDLFKSIADEALNDLAPHCQLLHYKAGDTLFEQGESAEYLFLVVEGEIALLRRYEGGDLIKLTSMGPNDVIGELSMMVGETRSASAVALQDSTVIMLHHDQLFKYLNQYPSVAMSLMLQMAIRLRNTTLMVREWAMENAEARLAALILFLAEEDGEIKTGLVSSNLRLRNLARGAGVEINWLKEKLEEWSFEGYIGLDGRRFLLHDADAMRAIAGWQ